MSNYSTLKTAIQEVVKTNGNKEITGALMQQTLFAMVNSLGAKYQYAGIAIPSTNPGTPDQNVFYLSATPGIYANMGGFTLEDGQFGVFTYNGTWAIEIIGIVSKSEISELNRRIFDVTGRYDYPTFYINEYYNTSGEKVSTNGWAASEQFILIDGVNIVFAENAKNYYMRRIVVYNDSGTYLGTIYPTGTLRYVYPVATIKSQYPTAYMVGIGLSDGTTTTPMSQSDIADWVLSQIKGDSVIQEINQEIDEINTNLSSLNTSVSKLIDYVGTRQSFNYVLNELITNNGNIVSNNGWAHTDRMEIWQNSQFEFSQNTLNYYIYYALLYDQNNNFLGYRAFSQETSQYKTTSARLKELFPTAKYVIFDLWGGAAHAALTSSDIADWNFIQEIQGEIQDEFERIDTEIDDLREEVEGATKTNTLHCDLTPGAISYVISDFNSTYKIKTAFKISRQSSTSGNPVFNFDAVYLVNKSTGTETAVHTCQDDICPASYNNSYIGANHADSDLREITATGHGKTAVDVGSVWSIGGIECTLVGIPTANTLLFMGANIRTYPLFTFNTDMFVQGATITHVSGATHTGNISIESVASKQWYSAMISGFEIYMDGKRVTQSGDYKFEDLKICEIYDVLNPASVIDKMRQAVGTLTANPNPNTFTNADKVVRHSITYEFISASEWRITTNFLAYQNITISYFGFTQQGVMTGNIQMYIPKALPISNGEQTIDFRTIVAYGSVPQTMNLTADYWENPNLPPDRWLQISQYIALHSGYLFDYGVGGNNRKDHINNAFFLYTSRKCYPHGIDSKITVNAGDNFSAVVWRSYKDVAKINANGIIASNVFEYAGNCYIYADFNATGIYEIEIPSKFIGRKIEVFEKRSNVELLNDISNSKILVKVVSGTPMYGYFVAKING